MFCRYCGREIQTASHVCENCGKEQKEFRCTNGYFGIIEAAVEGMEAGECKENVQITDRNKEEVDAYQEKIYLQEQLHNKERDIITLEEYFLKLKRILLFEMIVIIILIFVLLIVGIRFFVINHNKHSISCNTLEAEEDIISENNSEVSEDTISENKPEVSENTISENKPEVSENTISENKPEVSGNSISENKPEAREDTVSENKPEVSGNTISENKPEAREDTVSENKPGAGEGTISENISETENDYEPVNNNKHREVN